MAFLIRPAHATSKPATNGPEREKGNQPMKKHMQKLLVAAAIAVGLTGTLAAQPAHADNFNISVGMVHVRLPGGTVISVNNTPDRPWWYDQRIAAYHRYVYDPVQRVYVIHNDYYGTPIPPRRIVYRHTPPRGHWHGNGHGNGHRDNGWHGRHH